MIPSRPIKKSQSNSISVDLPPSFLQYGSTKWTEKLIELVLGQPALYNHVNPNYRNIATRDLIWESIGITLQTSAEDIKRRWRSLRDTYSRILRNRHKKGLSDRGPTKKWMWADKMEPLGVFLPTTTYGDGDMDSSDLLEVRIEDASGSLTQDSAPGVMCKRELPDWYDDDSGAHGTDENAAAPDNGEPGPSTTEINLATSSTGKRPYPYADESFDPSVGYFEDEKRPKMDPIDLLFLAHASTVKTFSARRQAIAKLKIAEVIMQEELNHQEDLDSSKNE